MHHRRSHHTSRPTEPTAGGTSERNMHGAPAGPIGEALPRLLITVEEAAQRLGIGRSTAYELIASGRLESVTIGRLRRIPTEALNSFIASLRA